MILQGQNGEGKRPKPLMIEWPAGTPAAHVVLSPFFIFSFFLCFLPASFFLFLFHSSPNIRSSSILRLAKYFCLCNRPSPHVPRNPTAAFLPLLESFGQETEPDKGRQVDVHRQVSTYMVWLALFLRFSSPSLRSRTACSLAVRTLKRWEDKQGLQNGKEDMSWTSLYYFVHSAVKGDRGR